MSVDIYCQCCLNKCDDQVNMSSPVNNQGILEVYEEMLQYCTGIQLRDSNIHYICKNCISKLRESCIFKNQVEETQSRLTIMAFESPHIKTEYDIEDASIKNHDSSSDVENITRFKPVSEVPITFDINQELDLRTKSCDTEKECTVDENYSSSSESESDSENYLKQIQKNKPKSKHKISNKKSSLLKCKKCTATFNSSDEYDLHTKSCVISRICPHCGKTFDSNKRYHKHKSSHSAKVQCKICNKFVTKSNKKKHEKLHNGETIYTCYQCPERFKYFHIRKKHMVEVHGAEPSEYPCNICSRTFESSSIRRNHINRYHLLEAKHSCTECNKSFFETTQLEKHMLVHTAEKNFECEICHKRLCRKSSLKKHLKIHYNIKDHKCNICQRAFTNKFSLMGHLKTHK